MKHLKELSLYNHNVYELDNPIRGYSFLREVCEDGYHIAVCELGMVENGSFSGSGIYFGLNKLDEDGKGELTEKNVQSADLHDEYIWT